MVRITKNNDAAKTLVQEVHRRWKNNTHCTPTMKELMCAEELLSNHSEDVLQKILSKVIQAMHDAKFVDAMYFNATQRFVETTIAVDTNRQDLRRREELQRAKVALEEKEQQVRRGKKMEQTEKQRQAFVKLPEDERQRIQQNAVETASSDFIRRRIREKGIGEDVAGEVLMEFA